MNTPYLSIFWICSQTKYIAADAAKFQHWRDELLAEAEAAQSQAQEGAVEAAAWKNLDAKLLRAPADDTVGILQSGICQYILALA